jgi:hypothetical protein
MHVLIFSAMYETFLIITRMTLLHGYSYTVTTHYSTMVFPPVDAIRHSHCATSDKVSMPKLKANYARQLTVFDVTGDQITVFLFDLRL